MHLPTDLEFLIRVLLATGCGALIGLERQYRSRTAGLRTQALVAAGAASFVLFGEQVGNTDGPVRIVSYVVSGVGFLGGGVILRQGFSVQGLNTAATLWCSAAIGCQAAAGHVVPALTLTAIVLAIHTVLRPCGRLLDRTLATKDESIALYTLLVEVDRPHEPHLRARLQPAVDDPDITVRCMTARNLDEDSTGTGLVEVHVEMLIEGSAHTTLDGLVTRLAIEPGVRAVSWHAEDTATGSDDDNDDSPEPASTQRRTWRPPHPPSRPFPFRGRVSAGGHARPASLPGRLGRSR
jgi:putative Mg2+ transporter-C (MgtC) family protein